VTVDLTLAEVESASSVYDVYVVLFKDGKVSGPIKINTKEGEVYGDWIWGDEPYKGYYVASGGDDAKPGTRTEPLATVQQALTKLAALYAADASWPDKGTEDEVSGGIIILDEVKVEQQITIDNANSIYPPIILCDDPETPGGKLKAQASIGSGNSLLRLQNNVRVTLDSGLILAGTGIAEDNVRGVHLTGASTLIMNSGKISDNYGYNGSGVLVSGESTFTMNGGEISGNTATNYAGGVDVTQSSTFIMNGGKISGNTSGVSGGVEVVHGSTFAMKGGEISGNRSAGVASGGVFICAGEPYISSKFEKTGGIIYGIDEYDADDPASKGNSANAVWVGDTFLDSLICRKEATSGPENILRYNYPSKEDIGWDE
jgi:hypothetical protein